MLPIAAPPAPIQAFALAGGRMDLEALFRLVDWPLTHAAGWARSLSSPALPEDRAIALADSGIAELDRVTLPMVRNRLGEICVAMGAGGQLRPATDAEAARVLAAIQVPVPTRAFPPRVTNRLDVWRQRAQQASEPWCVEASGKRYWLALDPERERVILVDLR